MNLCSVVLVSVKIEFERSGDRRCFRSRSLYLDRQSGLFHSLYDLLSEGHELGVSRLILRVVFRKGLQV